MKRKRFVKLMMSHGYSRNEATKLADKVKGAHRKWLSICLYDIDEMCKKLPAKHILNAFYGTRRWEPYAMHCSTKGNKPGPLAQ